MVFLERSSFRGRWRAVGSSGEPGSFLTMILGGGPAFRELLAEKQRVVSFSVQSANWRLLGEIRLGNALLTRWEEMISLSVEVVPWGSRYLSAVVRAQLEEELRTRVH